MNTAPFYPLLFLSFFLFADGTGKIGVNYGRVADNLPAPEKVVELLKSHGINRVKIFDTESTVLTALANSGISVVVCLPNQLLASAAADRSFANSWVKANISRYYPKTQIEAIAVGNEVFADPQNTAKYLVPAMKNIYKSLVKSNLTSIKVSSPVALSALQNSYPSSAGVFKKELIPVIKPMLKFFRRTGSYLMVNIYPFFAYSANSNEIALDYALFKKNPGAVDPGTGLKYYSLLDAQADAVFAAMSALRYDDVKLVVTETGWPSKGDENEIGASEDNAASYNGNLTGKGTPLRPKDPLNVYLFALFNENQKPGPTSERNYGLFYPNEQKVYSVPLKRAALSGGRSAPTIGNKTHAPTTGKKNHAPAAGFEESKVTVGHTWCVANGKVGDEKLQAALDYACGEGRADCHPIQSGATCYHPNTLEAHASYAFNSYYQKNGRGIGACDFNGAAYVVTQPPRYGKCKFPTGY